MKSVRLKYLLVVVSIIIISAIVFSTKVIKVEDRSSEAAEKLWSEKAPIEPGLHTATLQTVQQEFIQLASTLNPAVVNISTETEIKLPKRMKRPPNGVPNGGRSEEHT